MVEQPQGAIVDSCLSCPQCDYNLTGLPENVCPECGAGFDPETLRWRPAPIPGWEQPGLLAFIHVCLMTWVKPGEFAAAFPARYDTEVVSMFRHYARAAAALTVLATSVLLNTSSLGVVAFLVTCYLLAVAARLTEAIISRLLDRHVRRKGVDSPFANMGLLSWAGFVVFYRSFLIMSAPAVAVLANGWRPQFGLILLAIVGWWTLSLSRGVRVQGRPSPPWFVLAVFLPLAAAAGSAVAALPILFVVGRPGMY